MPATAESIFDPILTAHLAEREKAGLLRRRRIVRPIDATHVEIDGRRLVHFCGNDYLGLSHHPKVIAAMQQAAERWGAGSGASGLISGCGPAQVEAERAIAAWKGAAGAVLLPSGYQANHAIVQTLAAVGAEGGGKRFLLDKLAHASLVDAVRGSGAAWRVFPHNGMGKLRRLLTEAKPGEMQVVVTESIFSMDGDAADLAALARMKQEHPFFLLLDEAHGSGVYGERGAGLAAEMGVNAIVDAAIVTLSKAAGCMGGAICGSAALCEAVVNWGRAYIYSTAISPAVAGGISAAIAVMDHEPRRRKRVRELALGLRERLSRAGFKIPTGDSPIIPIVVGAEAEAAERAEALLAGGLLVQAIRPPTVPRGTSRLRLTLCCEHSDAEVDELAKALGA